MHWFLATLAKLTAYKRQLETPLARALPQINILWLYLTSYISLQMLLWASFSLLLGCTNLFFFPFELSLCSFYSFLSRRALQSRTFSSRTPSRARASSSANLQIINVFMKLKGFIWKYKIILQDLQAYCFLKCNTVFEIMTTFLLVAIFLLSNEGFLPANLKYKFNQRLQKYQVDSLRYI